MVADGVAGASTPVRESLTATPPDPVAFRTPEAGRGDAETVVLFLSDLHWGEAVSLAASRLLTMLIAVKTPASSSFRSLS